MDAKARKEGKFLPEYTGSDLTKKEAKEQAREVKMLSDISNYLGLNFYKFILVYSKVENNGELRGDELRAFLELGIPLLDELARRYKVDYGKILSKNEIFSMNSENPIPFKYTKKVFNDIHKEILIKKTTIKK